MRSHDELAKCLEMMFPGTRHGIEFLVAHPLDPSTGKQTDEAFIMRWSLPVEQPTEAQLEAEWIMRAPTVRSELAARDVRGQRKGLLADADIRVEHAMDRGDAEAERAARVYRQALRDVTGQTGFPYHIEWPQPPQ